MICRGFAYFDRGPNGHLWIVVTGPDDDGLAVVISITTRRINNDRTTTCGVGDHPFIEHESVIAYRYAECIDVSAIEAGIHAGVFDPREHCSDDLLARIDAGIVASDFTPLRIANEYARIRRDEINRERNSG